LFIAITLSVGRSQTSTPGLMQVNAPPRRIRAPVSKTSLLLAPAFQNCFSRLAADSRRKLRPGCLVSAIFSQLEEK